MATLKVDSASLSAVANALRTAKGTNSTFLFPDEFVSAIGSLSSGGSNSQFVCGMQNVSQTDTFVVNNLQFTPTHALILLFRRTSTKGVLVNAVSDPGDSEGTSYGIYSAFSNGYINNITTNNFTFGPNVMIYSAPGTCTINGLYFYLIWRSTGGQS